MQLADKLTCAKLTGWHVAVTKLQSLQNTGLQKAVAVRGHAVCGDVTLGPIPKLGLHEAGVHNQVARAIEDNLEGKGECGGNEDSCM